MTTLMRTVETVDWEDPRHVPCETRTRAFGWDPIRGLHQGQQPQRLHRKAEYMAAPDPLVEMPDFPLAPRALYCRYWSISGYQAQLAVRSIAQLAFDASQRRTMPRIGPSPHPARPRWERCARDLAIVAELAPDFPLGQRLSAEGTRSLRRIPKTVAASTREPWFEIIEHANAPATERALQPHPPTHDAAACPDQRRNDNAAADKLQIESGRVQPHHPQPWKSKVGAKYRAHWLLKHTLADQFAHVQRDVAVVFDRASAPLAGRPYLTRDHRKSERSGPRGRRKCHSFVFDNLPKKPCAPMFAVSVV